MDTMTKMYSRQSMSRSRPCPGWLWTLTLALGAFLLLPAAAQAQQATVTGQVLDEAGEPLPNAQISVVGTNLGALTGQDGSYSISDVEAGEQRIRAQSIGYGRQTETVDVPDEGEVAVNFTLSESAVALDEIVVSGRATGTARREIGSSIAGINVPDLEAAPVSSMSQLLQGRAPGVSILSAGGKAGQGSRIVLRGLASISQANTPIIYLDGVRMDNSSYAGIRTTGPSWAGLDDINPNDIENIEVIRGASAATLYGTEAAAGVINITTRRGADGAPQWNLRTEQGLNRTPRSWWQESTSVFSDWTYDNLVQDGHYHNTALSLSGGSNGFNYYASGTLRGDGGTQPNNFEDYGAFRTNMQLQALDDLTLGVNAGYVQREVMQPPDGNNQEGMINNALIGGPAGNWNPPLDMRNLEMFQGGQRFTGGTNAEWTPGNFTHRVTLGADIFNSDNREFLPPEVVPRFSGGYAGNYRRSNRNFNLDAASTFRTDLTDNLRSTTSAGFQAFRSFTSIQSGYGENFPFAGLRTVSGTSSDFSAGESRVEERMAGFFGEQQFGIADILFVTGGLRADAHSAFGEDVDFQLYPKVDASYVLSEHGFWNDALGSLRLRAAYGTAGQQPTAFSALRTWGASSGAGGLPSIQPLNVGNPDLRPEVTHELELGFDANVLNERVNLEFTYYNQDTRDALYATRNIPSQGFLGTQLANIGRITNVGVEVGAQLAVIELPAFRWDARANLSTNSNEVADLAGEAPQIVRWRQFTREGFPVASFFASNQMIEHEGEVINKNTLCADFPASVEEDRAVNCTDAEEFIGPSIPTRNIQLGSDFSLGENVTFGFFFDHQGGHYRTDHTLRWLMDPRRDADPGNEAVGAAPGVTDDMENALSTRCRQAPEGSLDFGICNRNSLLSHGEFVVPADFWRLREVTLAYRLPQSLMQVTPASSATLTLAGRNLWRWMASPSLEAEANLSSQSTLQNQTYFDTPLPQQIVAGISVQF